jgi:hypothetical protein
MALSSTHVRYSMPSLAFCSASYQHLHPPTDVTSGSYMTQSCGSKAYADMMPPLYMISSPNMAT